jgi:hypothetical protein
MQNQTYRVPVRFLQLTGDVTYLPIFAGLRQLIISRIRNGGDGPEVEVRSSVLLIFLRLIAVVGILERLRRKLRLCIECY